MPVCPRCGASMRLARVWPAAFGHPELRSYACTQCREAVTVEGCSKPRVEVTHSFADEAVRTLKSRTR